MPRAAQSCSPVISWGVFARVVSHTRKLAAREASNADKRHFNSVVGGRDRRSG